MNVKMSTLEDHIPDKIRSQTLTDVSDVYNSPMSINSNERHSQPIHETRRCEGIEWFVEQVGP